MRRPGQTPRGSVGSTTRPHRPQKHPQSTPRPISVPTYLPTPSTLPIPDRRPAARPPTRRHAPVDDKYDGMTYKRPAGTVECRRTFARKLCSPCRAHPGRPGAASAHTRSRLHAVQPVPRDNLPSHRRTVVNERMNRPCRLPSVFLARHSLTLSRAVRCATFFPPTTTTTILPFPLLFFFSLLSLPSPTIHTNAQSVNSHKHTDICTPHHLRVCIQKNASKSSQ